MTRQVFGFLLLLFFGPSQGANSLDSLAGPNRLGLQFSVGMGAIKGWQVFSEPTDFDFRDDWVTELEAPSFSLGLAYFFKNDWGLNSTFSALFFEELEPSPLFPLTKLRLSKMNLYRIEVGARYYFWKNLWLEANLGGGAYHFFEHPMVEEELGVEFNEFFPAISGRFSLGREWWVGQNWTLGIEIFYDHILAESWLEGKEFLQAQVNAALIGFRVLASWY